MDWNWVKQQILEQLDEFTETYHKSLQEDQEKGFMICLDIKEGKPTNISIGKKCSGSHCSIVIENCNEKGIPLGTFHTHLEETSTMFPLSSQDILVSLIQNNKVNCIGNSHGLVCFIFQKDSPSIKELQDEIKPYLSEEAGKKILKLPIPEGMSQTQIILTEHPKIREWQKKIEQNLYDIVEPILLKGWNIEAEEFKKWRIE